MSCSRATLLPFATFLFGLVIGLSLNSSLKDFRKTTKSLFFELSACAESVPSAESESTTRLTTESSVVTSSTSLAPAALQTERRPKIGSGLIYLTGGSIVQSEGKNMPLLFYKGLPSHLKNLPIVDVGVHDGTDYTIPSAQAGYRVYAYEPTGWKYERVLGELKKRNITVTDELDAFRRGQARVLLRRQVAAGQAPGVAELTTSVSGGGALNSLYQAAIPKDAAQLKRENVTLVTLSEDLKGEKEGVLLLKMDCQGCEYNALLGARDYIKTHKVYSIFFEFYSKGLQAAGVEPLKLLELITVDLGYDCFNMRQGTPQPISLEDFARMYRYFEGQRMASIPMSFVPGLTSYEASTFRWGRQRTWSRSQRVTGKGCTCGARTTSCPGRRQP